MPPIDLLCIILAVTAGASAGHRFADARRRRAFKELAARWEMHYAARDPFRLADRIAAKLEIPGAANVRLRDLVYGIEGDSYRYFFTLEYTIGAVSGRSRVQCVATFVEPRHGKEPSPADSTVACDTESSLQIMDRYEKLRVAQAVKQCQK